MQPMSPARTIDIDDLWRAAARKLGGWSKPPDDVHLDGLRCLASALARPGRYTEGELRLLQRELFVRILADLSVSRDIADHPEIADIPVRRPLLITGYGRTGSTLLHNLIALDPHMRAPRLWELWSPSPPPRPETAASDPRIAFARRRLKAFTAADPSILKIHPMAALAPDECHWMMRHNTLTPMFYQAPEYWEWLKQLGKGDLHQLYSHYRLQVQHLQLYVRGDVWVSKSPTTHLHFLPVLFDVFPDANVVRLHRHPSDAVPSLCSLVAGYRRLFAQRVDYAEIGSTLLDMFVDNMDRSMAAPADKAGQITDIRFEDLVADPVATVRSIYRRFGYPYGGASFEGTMARHLESEQAAKARHTYALDQFGLSPSEVIDRCGNYLRWLGTHGSGSVGGTPS
ncbi:sulfotransferase [Bradyrhizobium diazoefficiens]|nr:sulfotransferase [Bradyrhizobium diazoefficiens]MBR0769962.1 sulfotransferase [Bradyrhizobium diazoefficiens]